MTLIDDYKEHQYYADAEKIERYYKMLEIEMEEQEYFKKKENESR